MRHTWSQFRSRREEGYFSLFGGIKGLTLYGLLALAQLNAIYTFESSSALSYLLFPIVLGIAILAGLAFQMAGAVASFIIVLLVGGILFFAESGIFSEMPTLQGAVYFLSISFVVGVFSLLAGLVVGYSRRTAEFAEHRQNLLYKIFDALPIGIWVRARDGRSLFVNERWASFSHMTVDEILSSAKTEAPVQLGKEWEANIREVLKSDDSAVRYQSIELTDSKGVKSSMTLLTLRMYIDLEADFGTLSLLVDETALRLYESKVRQGEQNLHLALNNAQMGFWDENVKTREVVCDDNWYHLIDLEPDPGKTPLDVWCERLHPDDRDFIRRQYREFYESGSGSLRLEYRIRKGGDTYLWVQDSVRITDYDESGKPARVMGTMQDISEQKQIELELKHAKERAESANEAKSQFIATISHEIRTPLNAIIGLSSFLTEGDLEGEQLDLAQTIYTSGKSLLLLVNDILDFSKIEAGRLELEVQEFPIRLCFDDCIKLFNGRAQEKNVGLNLELSGKLPEFAAGDMERLRQIVQNLLGNALKFTNEGEVNVTVRPVTLEQVDESRRPDHLQPIGYLDQPDHSYIEVRVEDTGIGIPKERRHVLFEAFSQVDASTTRKYGGTGLGLVICKRLVDAMGGCIWVESEEGKGSSFCFIVRTKLIHEDSELEGITRTPFDASDRIAEKYPCDILIVGSEEATKGVASSCRKLGYAPHSIEGYDLSSSSFRRRRYNVVFVSMEDELNAMELTRKISSAGLMFRPDTIIGIAREEQVVSQDRCRLSGMHQVFQTKPTPGVIRGVIMSVVGAHD